MHSLLNSRDYQEQLTKLREQLLSWMTETNDSVAPAFRNRNDASALATFMESYTAQAKREMEQRRIYEEGTGYRF